MSFRAVDFFFSCSLRIEQGGPLPLEEVLFLFRLLSFFVGFIESRVSSIVFTTQAAASGHFNSEVAHGGEGRVSRTAYFGISASLHY